MKTLLKIIVFWNLAGQLLFGRNIYLNGQDISSAYNQTLKQVDVYIDPRGQVFISAPHYRIEEEETFLPLGQAPQEVEPTTVGVSSRPAIAKLQGMTPEVADALSAPVEPATPEPSLAKAQPKKALPPQSSPNYATPSIEEPAVQELAPVIETPLALQPVTEQSTEQAAPAVDESTAKQGQAASSPSETETPAGETSTPAAEPRQTP